jgi:hypothetical protein
VCNQPSAGRDLGLPDVNDADAPIERVTVEAVSYEWGDFGNEERVGTSCGPIAAGHALEVYREVDTELRTALTLLVRDAAGTRRWRAEVGRLYATPGALEPILLLGRTGKRAELELRDGSA